MSEKVKPFVLHENRSLPYWGKREFPERKSVRYYDDKLKKYCTLYFDLNIAEQIALSDFVGKQVQELFSALKKKAIEPTYKNKEKFYALFEDTSTDETMGERETEPTALPF